MKNYDFENSKTAVLLLSHGSRLPDGKKVIEAYTEMFKEEYPNATVEYAFMELREPDIKTSIEKLTKENDVERIIVVPVFIAHGLHTKIDIPKILGIESEEIDIEDDHHHEEETVDFDGEIILTDPLGIEDCIFEIIKKRVKENL